MTNDGTQGDQILNKIKSKNYRFWVNGVDEQKLPESISKKIQLEFEISLNTHVFLTVCRLVNWKRVERGIHAISKLIKDYEQKNIIYFIVGDGQEKERLKQLALSLNIDNHIRFTGAINNDEVKKYLNVAQYFILTYDASNVGNPLLEAISANKIIFTLNNGDTSKWIQHHINGFIYDIDADNMFIDKMAFDMNEVINNSDLKQKIMTNIKVAKFKKLWSWNDRLRAEIDEVEKLLQGSEY